MPEIPKTYASPGLRWGLFLHDHPKAKNPHYEVMGADAMLDTFGLPPQFGAETEDFTGLYVVCTIDPGDGRPSGEVPRAWKEIPKREKTRSGHVAFVCTPENWRKLCTMALGRTLKEAGYPDDTEDLKALLLWRRRSIELEMLAAGGPLAELGTGAPVEDQLDRAARPTPDADHDDTIDGEPEESAGEVVGHGPSAEAAPTDGTARPGRGSSPSASAPAAKRVKPAWVREFQAKADAAGVTDKDRREIARSISQGRTESVSALDETEAAAAERALATIVEELHGEPPA